MINNSDFILRLKKVMDFHQLTASNFADLISVQRSSISHILSGRNKPSLDFVLKITNKFPDVDMYWLLNGKGEFPKKSNTPTLTFPRTKDKPNIVKEIKTNQSKQIQRIVVFYTDGTFEEYQK